MKNFNFLERIEKPWGYELIWAKTDKYVGKILFIKNGHRLSRQYHEIKDETIFVIDGELLIELGTDEVIMSPGMSVRIEPGTIHRFCASCDTDVRLVEVSTTELDDVIRLSDDYSRADK